MNETLQVSYPIVLAVLGFITSALGWSLNRNLKTVDARIKSNELEMKEIKINYLDRFDEIKSIMSSHSDDMNQKFLDLHVLVSRVETEVTNVKQTCTLIQTNKNFNRV